MHPALNRNLYLVKEYVGMFKAADHFNILDPEIGELMMNCREDKLGVLTRILRFAD